MVLSARHRRRAMRAGSYIGAVVLVSASLVATESLHEATAHAAVGSWALLHPGIATVGVPMGQTFGGESYGVNPTAVEDDVNSGDGALEVAHRDLTVAGIGVPFELTRQYNSRDTGVNGSFGPGWSSILDLGVRYSSDGQTATVYGEDGQQAGFTWQASSRSWKRDPGVRSALSCSGPATGGKAPASCTVTRYVDGVHWSLSHGRVQNYLAADGQGLHFDYSGSHISGVVVETTARTPLVVSITRNSHGRVTRVSTSTRHISYAYDAAGDLTAFTDAAGRVWRMTYGSAHHLDSVNAYPSATSKTAASTLTATYDPSTGRVASCVSLDDATGFNATFGWTTAGGPTSGTATRDDLFSADGLTGQRWESDDQYSNGVIIQKVDSGGDAEDLVWNGDLDNTATYNPFGDSTTMTYDSAGDEVSSVTQLDPGQNATSSMTYDSAHRLTSTTDADGLVTRFSYTSGGELASETRPGGGKTTFSYGTDGLLAKQTDPLGNVTTYRYDAAGNVINRSITTRSGQHPVGNGPIFAYDEAGDETMSVPAVGDLGSGRTVTADRTFYNYDADGELVKTSAPGGTVTSTTYDAAGNITSQTNAVGETTTYNFAPDSAVGDAGAVSESITGPAGTTMNVFDTNGDLLSSTPPVAKASDAAAATTTYTYDATADVASETDARGNLTTFTRDSLGDVLTTTSMDVTRTDTYNDVGWLMSSTTTTTIYPPDNGTPGAPQYSSSTTSQQYDGDGNLVSATDSTGGVTTYAWSNGHVVDVNTGNGTTTYGFDADGNITSVTSEGGLVTRYGYDALGHVTSKTVGVGADSSTWTATYDADGNLASTTDPNGRQAKYGFNVAGLETSVRYGWEKGQTGLPAPSVTWSYNAAGERTEMVDGVGTHRYTYDDQGRVTSMSTTPSSGGTAKKFSYDYSKAAQVTTTYPDGTKVTDTMDNGGNLTGVSVPQLADGTPAFTASNMLPATATTHSSDASAALSSASAATPSATATGTSSDPATLPPTGTSYSDGTIGYTYNAPVTAYFNTTYPTYDQAGGLASGTAYYTNGSMANSGNPTYYTESIADANGYVLEEMNSQTSQSALYGYNGNGVGLPVSPATTSGPSGATSGVRLTSLQDQLDLQGIFQYGPDGTMSTFSTTTVLSGTSVVFNYDNYNSRDEITTSGSSLFPQNIPWTYDAAGNARNAYVTPPYKAVDSAGLGWGLRYNAAGQLAQATYSPQNVTVTYGYDGDGNLASEKRVIGSSAPVTIALQYDVRPKTPQLAVADVHQGTSSTHQRYIWGNGPLALEENINGKNGTYYSFRDDNRGTPVLIYKQDGTNVEQLDYDPYGNLRESPDVSGTPVLVGFDASYSDPFTGLNDFGARWYDPVAAQFLTPSPVLAPTAQQSVESPYEFADDDPVNELQTGGITTTSVQSATSFLGAPGTSPLDQNAAAPPGNGPPAAPQPTLTPGSGIFASSTPLFADQLREVLSSGWGMARSYLTAPKTITQQSIKLAKKIYTFLQGTEEEPGILNAQAGVEERTLGTGTEDPMLASEGGVLEGAEGDAAVGLEEEGTDLFGGAGLAAGVGFQIYDTAQTCAEYGSGSQQCIVSATTVTISTIAFVGCEALTGGTGSFLCSGLQTLLNIVLPYVLNYLAPVFGILYQTFGAIGDFIASGLSILSQVGSELASFVSTLVSVAAQLADALDTLFNVLGSQLTSLFDSIGSAFCDLASSFSCLF